MPQFNTIQELQNYINTKFVSNGSGEISAVVDNTTLVALTDFIVRYGINTEKADVSSTLGILTLSKPITIIALLPSSMQWPDNIQNQYYIINTLGVNVPLSVGYSYFNEALVEYNYIPALSTVQIVKAINGSWIKVNTATSGAIEIPNSATDNNAIKIVLSNTLNRDIQAVLEVSEDVGNALEIRADGVYVPPSSGSGSSFTGDFF